MVGSGSIEDDIASENTTPSEDSNGSHPPQVNHYPMVFSFAGSHAR